MRSAGRNDDPYIKGGIILAVILFLFYVYPGFFIPVTPHFDGDCKPIPLTLSAEDIRIDPTNGLVYMTYYDNSDARRTRREPDSSGVTGTVMVMDPNAAEPHVRAALTTEPAGFKPSGLSLYHGGDKKLLFVTSRSELGKHSVQIFEQTPTGAFAPAQTIRDKLLWSPTAIAAVGPRQFYVVNMLGFKRMFEDNDTAKMRDRLRGNQSTVVYYDGQQMKIVARGLKLASGIAVSADGRTVYVAESAAARIQTFVRDPATGALQEKDRIRLPSSPRNLTVDADGSVWVTAQPRALPFFEMITGDSEQAPTQVLKVTPSAAPDKQVEDIYVGDGKTLAAGTVAAPRTGNQFVIGSRSDHKLLVCTRGVSSSF